MKRLGRDDLELLNLVRAMERHGMTEGEIAGRLGMSEQELQERSARIRSAFLSLTDLVAQATGERSPDAAEPWAILIEEGECVAA